MSKISLKREEAILCYKQCISKFNYIYYQEKQKRHQYVLYRKTVEYLRGKLTLAEASQSEYSQVCRKLHNIYTTEAGAKKQQLLRNYAADYYETLDNRSILDINQVLDVTVNEIEGELADEELNKIEKEEKEI